MEETEATTKCTGTSDCSAEAHANDCEGLRENLDRAAYDDWEWTANNEFDY